MPTLGTTRQQLARFVSKRLGRPFCDSSVFRRIPISRTLDYISKINFPDAATKGKILSFVSDNKEHIIPLLGRIDRNAPASHQGNLFLRSTASVSTTEPSSPAQDTLNILKLIYEPGIQQPIPTELGCRDGVSFDLSSLKVQLKEEDLYPDGKPQKEDGPEEVQSDEGGIRPLTFDPNMAALQRASIELRINSSEPDDPNNPPRPNACMFANGFNGPCCKCEMAWTEDQNGCNQSYNCDSAYCCRGDSEDEFCPFDMDPWINPGRLRDLPIGSHL